MTRSSDSRTLRWTVHLTAKEFRFLEMLREQLGEAWGLLSCAQLLMALAEHRLDDALGPDVLQAWQQVEKEMYWTDDHSSRGGRRARVNMNRDRHAHL